jgi:putative membrane protein
MKRLVATLLVAPSLGISHAGEPLQPHDLWRSWDFEPAIVLPLALTAILYAKGARRSRGVSTRQMAYFWIGWTLLTLSLISPLHPLGEVLFSAHMSQHEILILAAAPLLVLARPLVALLWALPIEWRRRAGCWSRVTQPAWQALTRPIAAWLIHAVALWIWHVPALFQATLSSDWMHAAQHLSFFGSALIFWWSLLNAHTATSRAAGVLYIFSTGVHTSILGALLTFSTTLWYPLYSRTAAWGLTPLEDQQVGGLIMWVPAGGVYVVAGLGLLVTLLHDSDVREPELCRPGSQHAA